MAANISIIVPNYNRQYYLSLALKSILNQTVQDFEVVVVDDDSADDSVGMVEQMRTEDSRLRILVHQKNRGLSAARNTGIQDCRSKYVTFLDSDDLFAQEGVEVLCSRLDAGEGQSVIYTDWVKVGAGEVQMHAEQSPAQFRPEGMISPYLLAGSFRFTGGLIALPKRCFDEIGLYDESLRWAEDTDMILQLSSRFPFLFERHSTHGWRSHEGSSSNVMKKSLRFREESQVLERHILSSIETLDSVTKRQAFSRLFECYISARAVVSGRDSLR
jgi:glycosyltransferase involved in cell wall biosynthesis